MRHTTIRVSPFCGIGTSMSLDDIVGGVCMVLFAAIGVACMVIF